MNIKCAERKAAKKACAAAETAVLDARKRLACAREEELSCAEIHGFQVATPAYKRQVCFLNKRGKTDELLRAAMTEPKDAWEWIPVEKYTRVCDHDDCWYEGNLDRIDEFKGFYRCVYDHDVCFCDLCMPGEEEAKVVATNNKDINVDNVLWGEPDEAESSDSAFERACAPPTHNQWRQIDQIHLPRAEYKCIICSEDSSPMHILVARPEICLCSKHHPWAIDAQKLGRRHIELAIRRVLEDASDDGSSDSDSA